MEISTKFTGYLKVELTMSLEEAGILRYVLKEANNHLALGMPHHQLVSNLLLMFPSSVTLPWTPKDNSEWEDE